MTTPLDPNALSEVAWVLLSEAITAGSMTRPDGGKILIDPDQFVKIIQWLASLKKRAPKIVSIPEDFMPKQTAKGEDNGTTKAEEPEA